MDGSPPDNLFLQERRRRLAAERMLVRTRTELSRAHSALVANADRLSLRYLAQREANLRLTDRQKEVLRQRAEAADKADRARRRLWHALEAMRDGFALFDADHHLVAANSVYLNLFDTDSNVGPGATVEDLFAAAAEEGAFVIEEDPDDWIAAQIARLQGERIEVQHLQTFDGRTIRFQDRRAPDGDIVSLAVDLSDVREREDKLAAARDAAEAAARAKADFLARMSHEIRTPMNGVMGLADLMLEGDRDEETRTYARTIRDSAEALLTIVNDTLDVSRLEADRVELRHDVFDLDEMLCTSLRLAAAGKPAEGIAIALEYPLDAPTRFVGDVGRVRQVMMNLVGNALKFTDEGHVLVQVSIGTGTEPAEIVIDVADTGPGVPADQKDKIFEAFGQVEGTSVVKEGTGLGLTISRGLAERMGGDIEVRDDGPTTGACFRFSLVLPQADGLPPLRSLPKVVAVPEGVGVEGDALERRLVAAGVSVTRGLDAPVVVVPISAPDRGDLSDVDWTAVPQSARVILLGHEADAPPALRARASGVLAMPATGEDLAAALSVGEEAVAVARASVAAGVTRVLVADDNETNRFLLKKMLASDAREMRFAVNGKEAVEVLADWSPDIILMDISMPLMDGFQATEAIRTVERSQGQPPVPIIALTAHAAADVEEALQDAGFSAFQTKPVRKQDLLDAMAEALASGREA